MTDGIRVAENLNDALHARFAADPELYLLGEDVVDPYGGAFKITKGLSGAHTERVLATPLSEGAIVGVASGLALSGASAIAEIMFGDFATLCFDSLVNFASKSVSMYGHRVPMRLVVRCPVGGNRGYGPTHSQSPQKHFIGVPGLRLYEMSPLHDNRAVLDEMLTGAGPCVFFEDKTLYTRRMVTGGAVDELFECRDRGGPGRWAEIAVRDEPAYDCLLIAGGGIVHRAIDAMRELLVEDEIVCRLLVPSALYPFDAATPADVFVPGSHIAVVEESSAGGTWGTEVAACLHGRVWESLRRPVQLVSSRDSIIPAAPQLEKQVLVQSDTIRDAVRGALR